MEKFLTGLVTFIGILVIAFLIDLLLAWPFMLLWNWLMPMIFGLTTLTFWQSFGLMLLASFLFKNSGTSNTSR
ncbi:MAG: hypothetical protein IJH39_05625 [Clostridia bacterium]|nr:hypothetical protein [Clostridia bacterium]